MRITHQMTSQRALKGMQKNFERLYDLQIQAASGKRIQHLQDDPFGAEQALGLRARIARGEGYQNTIEMSSDWLTATEQALSETSDLLTRAHALALKGANETLGEDERRALAIEVNDLLEEVLDISNRKHGDQSLFAGFRTDREAFAVTRDATSGRITAATYEGDQGQIQREILPNSRMTVNVNGETLFDGIFSDLLDLRDSLDAEPFDVDAVSAATTRIKASLTTAGDFITSTGAKLRRLESASTRIHEAQIELYGLLSKVEDADLATVITQLNQAEFTYQAALQVNARVLDMSLLDYLR